MARPVAIRGSETEKRRRAEGTPLAVALKFLSTSCCLSIPWGFSIFLSQGFSIFLSLGGAACCLLDLGLVLAPRSGAGSLGSGGLACSALDLLALDLVGDAGGVCHDVSSL